MAISSVFVTVLVALYAAVNVNCWNDLCRRSDPIVIQQNDGSNFFNRSWQEFKDGFRDAKGNRWIGNEKLNRLTQSGDYKVRVQLTQRYTSKHFTADYSTFKVDNEASNYMLHVGGFSGDTGYDAFSASNGAMFTTYDRDNDHCSGHYDYQNNCALWNGGGFWYGTNAESNVNAMRGHGDDFSWKGLPGGPQLKFSRIWLACPSHG